jgi:pyruvate ferredoxin oxidoreductase gamma subunit
MREIRWHGRGGQGAVTAAILLGMAAFEEGKYSQAFPFFGVERRGAPVMAYTRIDDRFIRTRQRVYEPDYVVVLDPTLMEAVNVVEGLKDGGMVVINTVSEPEDVELETCAKVFTVDATTIALEELGMPIYNTPMLGAFAKASGLVKLESVIKAVEQRFSGKIAEKNANAIKRTFSEVNGAP